MIRSTGSSGGDDKAEWRTRGSVRALAACALLTLASLMAGACGSSGAQTGNGPLTVRIAYMPNLTHAIGLVAVADGSLRKALAPHSLDVRSFGAGPAIIEALLAGEVQIAYVGPSPAVNGYVKSRGAALRVIAGASSGGALFVARPGSGEADLAGRTFATPQRGGTQDIALRYFAREHGLKTSDEGGPVTILPMQNADILSVFKTGRIDGAWVPEPWATRLVQEAGATVRFDERSRWPGGQFATTHVIVATSFLESHAEIVAAFLRAHVDASRFVREHAVEARTIANQEIARITTEKVPALVLESAFGHIDFTYDPLADSVAVMANRAFELGFLGNVRPDLRNLYALGPLNAVLREKALPTIGEEGTR